MSVPTWVEVINKLATPTIAAVSAFYVYLQYRRAQRWKANDLAATLLAKLDTDQALALACQSLDWGTGPLIIPDQYRPLFSPDKTSEAPAVMEHDPEVLSSALEPFLNAATLRDPRGLVYRFCFIKFFSYLDNLFRLLADKQVRKKDIDDIAYWLEMLADYPYAPQDKNSTEVFELALRDWGYKNVLALGARFGVKRWTSPTSADQ